MSSSYHQFRLHLTIKCPSLHHHPLFIFVSPSIVHLRLAVHCSSSSHHFFLLLTVSTTCLVFAAWGSKDNLTTTFCPLSPTPLLSSLPPPRLHSALLSWCCPRAVCPHSTHPRSHGPSASCIQPTALTPDSILRLSVRLRKGVGEQHKV